MRKNFSSLTQSWVIDEFGDWKFFQSPKSPNKKSIIFIVDFFCRFDDSRFQWYQHKWRVAWPSCSALVVPHRRPREGARVFFLLLSIFFFLSSRSRFAWDQIWRDFLFDLSKYLKKSIFYRDLFDRVAFSPFESTVKLNERASGILFANKLWWPWERTGKIKNTNCNFRWATIRAIMNFHFYQLFERTPGEIFLFMATMDAPSWDATLTHRNLANSVKALNRFVPRDRNLPEI